MAENTHELGLEGFSIVALGSFNPAIFQPLWFSANNLIRKQEAENAEIQIVHRDASIFSAEWFSLQVTSDRFAVESQDPTKSQETRDLVIGTFKVLEHTPVNAFGLNRSQHFRMSSEEAWHAFGHHFAPKKSWSAILRNPGLRALTIEGKRDDCTADRIQIKLEPSAQIGPGVFIHVNQHYQLKTDQESAQPERLESFLSTLHASWDDFLAYSQRVSEHLLAEYAARPE